MNELEIIAYQLNHVHEASTQERVEQTRAGAREKHLTSRQTRHLNHHQPSSNKLLCPSLEENIKILLKLPKVRLQHVLLNPRVMDPPFIPSWRPLLCDLLGHLQSRSQKI